LNTPIRQFSIGGHDISHSKVPYCIAEVGINHNGELPIAKLMIEAAKWAGADAVKFQTFKADEFCGDPHQMFTYKSQGETVTESMIAMFKRYEFTVEQWKQIKKHCDEVGITFLSTPQNRPDFDLLLTLDVPAVKIGSDDFNNLPLIKNYTKEKLPIILSCGMSDLADVHCALEAANWFNGYPVAILLCTSQYPTKPEDANIAKLNTLQSAFPGLVVGFSDHTQGAVAASLATACGAKIFEKHFTLDRNAKGPDHWFSETPPDLATWVSTIKCSAMMMGSPYLRPVSSELEMKTVARRSVVALRDIPLGEVYGEENIGIRRPGGGLAPDMLEQIVGLFSTREIKKGEIIKIGDICNSV